MLFKPSDSLRDQKRLQAEQNSETAAHAFNLGWQSALGQSRLDFNADVVIARERHQLEQTGVVASFAFDLGFRECLAEVKSLNPEDNEYGIFPSAFAASSFNYSGYPVNFASPQAQIGSSACAACGTPRSFPTQPLCGYCGAPLP